MATLGGECDVYHECRDGNRGTGVDVVEIQEDSNFLGLSLDMFVPCLKTINNHCVILMMPG